MACIKLMMSGMKFNDNNNKIKVDVFNDNYIKLDNGSR